MRYYNVWPGKYKVTEKLSSVRLAFCGTSKSPLIRPIGHLLPNGGGITSRLLPRGEGGRRPDEGVPLDNIH